MRRVSLAVMAALCLAGTACETAPPPPPDPPRVEMTMTLNRDQMTGASKTKPTLRGLSGCDVQIIEDGLEYGGGKTSYNAGRRPEEAYFLRKGSYLKFTVPNRRECWHQSPFWIVQDGEIFEGPWFVLEVPQDSAYTYRTILSAPGWLPCCNTPKIDYVAPLYNYEGAITVVK